MGHKHLLVDAMAEWQMIEQLREELKDLQIVLRLDFSFKPIKLVQVLGLVVASGHEEVIRVQDLPR